MTAEILMAGLIGASRTAMHLTLMAVVVVAGAAALGIARRLRRRDAAEAELAEQDHPLGRETSTEDEQHKGGSA